MRPTPPLLALAFLLCAACRDSDDAGASATTLLPNAAGANGCLGPDADLDPPPAPVAVALAAISFGPASHVTAAAGAELLYATGADATLFAIDVSGPAAVETELVGAGVVAALLAGAGVAAAPELAALAVVDDETLVVVETTSNTLLSVGRLPPHDVAFLAGLPSVDPGFADGLALGEGGLLARFGLDADSAVLPTGGGTLSVLVADSKNHAIRWLSAGSAAEPLFVSTVAGFGTPGFADGELGEALFDRPSGLTLGCGGLVVLTERGGAFAGTGARLRSLEIGDPSFFGGFFGSATTLAGDGTSATAGGVGALATLDQPVAPLATADGAVYWVDAGSGVLRRLALDGTADCPLAADCAAAVAAPSFPAGHAFSLTQTEGGALYVLDATDGTLWRVAP